MASSSENFDICKTLQEEVDDITFVDDEKKLKGYLCVACGYVAISHCFANCSDIFCTRCYQLYFKRHCPSCDAILASNNHYDEFEADILQLKVQCKYTNNGCKEVVLLRDFLKHAKSCRHSTEKLKPKLYKPNPVTEALEKLSIDFKNMEKEIKSMRDKTTKENANQNKEATDKIQTKVTHLKEKMLESEEKTKAMSKSMQNYEKAIKVMQEESNKKSENIEAGHNKEIQRLESRIQESKSQLDKTKTEHQSEIKRLESRLEYTKQENKSQMEKTKMEHQSEMQKLETVHKKHVQELTTKIDALEYLQLDDGCDCLPDIFIWKIPGITKIMKNLVEKKLFKYKREECFTNQNEEQFKPCIYTGDDGKYIKIKLEFMVANNLEPYFHSRRFFLIDQSTSMRKNNVEMIDRPYFKMNSAKDMMAVWLSTSLFFPPLLLQGENNYVKNDAILIKIILEPVAFLWKQIEAQDGVFLWRINDYSKKKRDEINGVKLWLTSKPFKTSHVGYTAHLELYLNGYGDDEGKYISIFLRFLLGEHDDSLPLPFKCKFTFCLIDQSDSLMKINRSTEFTDEFKEGVLTKGTSQFVLQSTVESSKYLKNDSIVIETTTEIL